MWNTHVYILIPNTVTSLMKNMYTVGVLVHGVHHTLPVSQHWFLALALTDSQFVVGGASAVAATTQSNNSLLVAVYFWGLHHFGVSKLTYNSVYNSLNTVRIRIKFEYVYYILFDILSLFILFLVAILF